ncbi:hypothetical protein MDV098.9 [Gallid alphaherpesvirus 2]|uniref:Uncharacterized protein n=1 Tax=Gallid alphaherpesvirus 2 TaxID=10390 RepID=Q19B12_9ALPH|nr:hypothetical protein MDV098.9 [Gallid alphaherpesvirus 2]UOW61189.1 hypothetical protein MDV085.3 [Gallid alphaherpesvirus 2]UOW61217.1 hypothetical protein MDV098.9 [Gallid alphaherpesvirus 2]UOW63393.1 hypothetical protein MDV085.3 [Gallid alphaherpesvirus 2]UOW63423.1 hypothetical protein MDV098.9 [Gallid alphaherpesvirus 2]
MGKYSRSHKINTNHPVFPHQKSPCREDGFEDRRLDRERAQKKKKKNGGMGLYSKKCKR